MVATRSAVVVRRSQDRSASPAVAHSHRLWLAAPAPPAVAHSHRLWLAAQHLCKLGRAAIASEHGPAITQRARTLMAASSSYHSQRQSLNSEGVAAEWLVDGTCVVPVECGGCVLGLGAELCVFTCCVAQTSTSSSHCTAPPRRVPPVRVLRRLGEHRLLPYPSQQTAGASA